MSPTTKIFWGRVPAGRINALRDALGSDFEVDTDMLRTPCSMRARRTLSTYQS
jgi:hypothetical protein